MTSPTNLFRLPFAEDVSAGERFAALARQADAAAQDINLPPPLRLQFFRERDRLEILGLLADADMVLAACKDGEIA